MGCDIHAYMEFKPKGSTQWSGWPRINLDRNYLMFGKLAGVRSDCEPVVPPRGIPSDLSYWANGDWWLLVDDKHADSESWCSQAQAESYQEHGSKLQMPGEDGNGHSIPRVEHPDWHTPSWVTADELLTAIAMASDERWPAGELEYRAMAAAMKELERQGATCRLVFWFDN
jgi:hypothetical protein